MKTNLLRMYICSIVP